MLLSICKVDNSLNKRDIIESSGIESDLVPGTYEFSESIDVDGINYSIGALVTNSNYKANVKVKKNNAVIMDMLVVLSDLFRIQFATDNGEWLELILSK